MREYFTVLLITLSAVGFGQGKNGGVIRTRAVAVEDENGKIQVDITAEENEPDILLYDSDGDGVVVLDKDQDTTGLEVHNREGKVRLKISARYIVIFGDDARERLRLTKEGVSLYDEQGKLVFFLGSNLGLFGEDGKLKLQLRAK